jgi:transposase
MEACSSAHYWARTLSALGHQVKLLAPDLVKPFRKSQAAKNDRNDAQAILITARQPEMRFVAVKSLEQQSILAVHRMREGWTSERTALINRVRGLLSEFGFWLGRSPQTLARRLPQLMQEEELPARVRALLAQAHGQLLQLEALMQQCELDIQAAWCGLVPKQCSSGGKERLGKITKRGDTYLRGLLTQGARSTLNAALVRPPDQRSPLEHWIVALRQRVGYHKSLVAIANKHARICGALLARAEPYDPHAALRHVRAAA